MKEFSSCKIAVQSCIEQHSFALAHLYKDETTMNVHIHDCFEIYYSISGGKQFLIDNCFYDIKPGDIFFINQYESHYLSQIDQAIHERIILSIYPEFLAHLSSQDTNLSYCFLFRDTNSPHQLHLTTEEQRRFLYFIHKLTSTSGFGEDLLDHATFLEIMVFLNKKFYKNCQKDTEEESSNYHTQVDDILSYINQNIQDSLTIEELSTHFYLSSSYLCRIFKATTGTTINKYITAKRISLSKVLLNQGLSVSDACENCGFHDYSNFLKSFTKAVGISPKKYAQFNS